MKINKIIAVLLIGFLFQSCLFHEEDIFDKPAYVRLTEAVRFNLENFKSAPNGWEMRYFPTNTQMGYTLLAKFHDTEFVTMMGRNATTGNNDLIATSRFTVRPSEGAVLSFDTENPVIHVFSQPNVSGLPLGTGFGGDFEFVVIYATEDFVRMRGLRRGTNIEMHRMPEGKSWSQHFDEIAAMRTYLFGTNPILALNLPNANFLLSGGGSGVFNAQRVDIDTVPVIIPFITTTYGIAFSRTFTPDIRQSDIVAQRFALNEDRTQLIAFGTNTTANIQVAAAADVFLNTMHATTQTLVFRNSTENMSASVRAIYDMIVSGLGAFTLDFIGFTNRRQPVGNPIGPSLTILSRGLMPPPIGAFEVQGFLGFNMTRAGDNQVSLVFTGNMDDIGTTYYNDFSGVSDFVALLNGTYTVSFQGGGFAPNVFRFVCNDDPNKWFDLFFR